MLEQGSSLKIINQDLIDYKLYISLRDEHLACPCSPSLLYTYIIRAEEIKNKWVDLAKNSPDSRSYQELLNQWEEEIPPIIKSSVVRQQALLWYELQHWDRGRVIKFMSTISDIQMRYSIST